MAEQERGGIFARLSETLGFNRRRDAQTAEMEDEREKRAAELMEEIKGLKPQFKELMDAYNALEVHHQVHSYVSDYGPSLGFIDSRGIRSNGADFMAVCLEPNGWHLEDLLCTNGDEFMLLTRSGRVKTLDDPTEYIEHMELFLRDFEEFKQDCYENIEWRARGRAELRQQTKQSRAFDDLLADATGRSETENKARESENLYRRQQTHIRDGNYKLSQGYIDFGQ